MKVNNIFSGVLQINDTVHSDDRGFFSEIYNENELVNLGIKNNFIQDNMSYSKKRGTLRGLHFQINPYSQSKLLRVIGGKILDCFVDLRIGSKTYGKYNTIELDPSSGWIYIPKGFAHGFCTLEDNTSILYKVDNCYSAKHDKGIVWNDPALNINWLIKDESLVISKKDRKLPKLEKLKEEDKFYYDK